MTGRPPRRVTWHPIAAPSTRIVSPTLSTACVTAGTGTPGTGTTGVGTGGWAAAPSLRLRTKVMADVAVSASSQARTNARVIRHLPGYPRPHGTRRRRPDASRTGPRGHLHRRRRPHDGRPGGRRQRRGRTL